MNTLRIKKNDTVKVIAGAHKGKTAKVVEVVPAQGGVKLEGIGVTKRHIKPNQLNPRGTTKEVHIAIDASKVALVVDEKGKTSRVGYKQSKEGAKVRVAKALKNKEIK